MSSKKNTKDKTSMHIRNKNRMRYDLPALIKAIPELGNYVKPNKFEEDSVDFSDPKAVKLLNKALLYHYYDIKHWEFSDENLCPPIPGRADYLHYLADLLSENKVDTIPLGDQISCLDIGVGASCIYPIIGVTSYGWKFIGSDINPNSIASAQKIINANELLKGKVACRLQKNQHAFFEGVLNEEEKIDLSLCNPPFHTSAAAAQKGTRRKVKNLSGIYKKEPTLNFAGISNELVYEGGEFQFIQKMMIESKKFGKNCFWFSTLVSKKAHLKGLHLLLQKLGVAEFKTIPMGTSNKASRIVAWTFLDEKAQKKWRTERWIRKKG